MVTHTLAGVSWMDTRTNDDNVVSSGLGDDFPPVASCSDKIEDRSNVLEEESAYQKEHLDRQNVWIKSEKYLLPGYLLEQ